MTSISEISSSNSVSVTKFIDYETTSKAALQKRCHISFQTVYERWAELNDGPIIINFAVTVQSA